MSEKLRSILHGAERTGSATGPRARPGSRSRRRPLTSRRADTGAAEREHSAEAGSKNPDPAGGDHIQGAVGRDRDLTGLHRVTEPVAEDDFDRGRASRARRFEFAVEPRPRVRGQAAATDRPPAQATGRCSSSAEGPALPRNASEDVRVSLQAARKLPLKRLAPGPSQLLGKEYALRARSEGQKRGVNEPFRGCDPSFKGAGLDPHGQRIVRLIGQRQSLERRVPTPVSSSRP